MTEDTNLQRSELPWQVEYIPAYVSGFTRLL